MGLDETMGSYLATTTKFRLLNETDAIQSALIEKVKNNEIDTINEKLFEGIHNPSSNTVSNKFDLADPGVKEGSIIFFYNEAKDKRGILHVMTFKVNYEELDKSSSVVLDVLYEQ